MTKLRPSTRRALSLLLALAMTIAFALPSSAMGGFDDLATVVDATADSSSESSASPDELETPDHSDSDTESEKDQELTDAPDSEDDQNESSEPAEESESNDPEYDLLPDDFSFTAYSVAYNPMLRANNSGTNISMVIDNFIKHRYPFKGGTSMFPAYIFRTSDGRAAYCVEPAKWTSTNGAWMTGSLDYDKLSAAKQLQIAKAIAANTSGTSDHAAYVATQVIIWEVAAGEKHRTGYIYDAVIAANAAQLSTAYESILSKMQSISGEIPSFMSADSGSATIYEMTDSSGSWSISLNNSNSNISLSASDFKSKSSFTYSVSGNTLTITSSSQPNENSLVEWSGGSSSSGLVFWKGAEQAKVSDAETGGLSGVGYMAFSSGYLAPPPEEAEDPKLGYLEITKYDGESSLPLGGAVFRIECDGFIDNAFSVPYGGAVCVIPIPEGQTSVEVTVTEVTAPHLYALDSTPQTITVTAGESVNVAKLSFANYPLPSSLTIYKYGTGNYNIGLPGALFRIRYADANISSHVWELSTGADGLLHIDLPYAGTLIVEELLPPDGGYVITQPSHTVTVEKGESKRLDIPNDKEPMLLIRKECSVTGQRMPGVIYDIWIKNGKYLGEFETNARGEIHFEGEPALYVVKEKRTLAGYILDTEPREILLDGNQSATLIFRNTPRNPIIIYKTDETDSSPIPDTWFIVTHVNGEYVGEYSTGELGYAVAAGLDPGWYLVRESRANPAYIATGETKLVQLKEGEPAAVYFFNKPRTGLVLRKYDAVTQKPIPGVVFSITELDGTRIGSFETDADGYIYLSPEYEDIWVSIVEEKPAEGYKPDSAPRTIKLESGKVNLVEIANYPYPHLALQKNDHTGKPQQGVKFKLMDRYGREVGIFTTSAAGQIHLTGMDEGRYYLQEVEAKPGFQLDFTVHEIALKWGETMTLTLVNHPLAALRIIKRDAETHKPIPGVSFLLYDERGNPLGEYLTDDKGTIEIPAELAVQKVKIRELKAAPGYVLDEQVRTVQLRPGETVEVIWDNEPERGQIRIVKKAAADNPVTGQKEGAILSGAVFEVYDEDLELVETITTDSHGIATAKDLPLGAYAIKEVKAPEYYFTDGKVFYAEIKLHGDVVKFEVLNTPADISVSVEKRGNVEVLAGNEMRYDFSNIANTSNVELAEFYWHDQLPIDAVRLKTIRTGTWNESLTYSVTYKTNLKSGYKTLAANLTSKQNHVLDCSPKALGLAANEYITDIRFDFGKVKPGFREDAEPSFVVTTLATLPDGYRIGNKADVGGRIGSKWVTAKDAWVTVALGKPKGDLPRTGYSENPCDN